MSSRNFSPLDLRAPLSSKEYNHVNHVLYDDDDPYPQGHGRSSIKRRQIRRREDQAFRREIQGYFKVVR